MTENLSSDSGISSALSWAFVCEAALKAMGSLTGVFSVGLKFGFKGRGT